MMVYPPADGHLSKYEPGPALINFVDAINDVTNLDEPPPIRVLEVNRNSRIKFHTRKY